MFADSYFGRSASLGFVTARLLNLRPTPVAGAEDQKSAPLPPASATATGAAIAPLITTEYDTKQSPSSGGSSDERRKSAAAAAEAEAAAALALQEDKTDGDAIIAITQSIIDTKRLSSARAATIRQTLEAAIGCMRRIQRFAERLERTRSIRFSTANPSHETQLLRLWSLVRGPDVRLSARNSSDWGELGFQGTDPATDFRGMGVLGLDQLCEFHIRYPTTAHGIWQDTQFHPKNWFGYAITGLNLTHDLFTCLYPKRVATPSLIPNVMRSVLARFIITHGITQNTFTALYALYFVRLNALWTKINPRMFESDK